MPSLFSFMAHIFDIIPPIGKKVPILLSIPHVGTDFPEELRGQYVEELAKKPDDTDFYLDRLYDFAAEMGLTTIAANYSRWVIDLNRTPNSEALYQDGRIITALTPITDFTGAPIYQEKNFEPNQEEVERRKQLYYYPYYDKIAELLSGLKKEFGQVLFWDAHSIREYVPSIQEAKFPALILGNNEEKTASQALIQAALKGLSSKGHELTHNTPFKGGNLTRHFGDPSKGIHALQLEMIKTLYMDDTEENYDENRADKIKQVLKNTFTLLIEAFEGLES